MEYEQVAVRAKLLLALYFFCFVVTPSIGISGGWCVFFVLLALSATAASKVGIHTFHHCIYCCLICHSVVICVGLGGVQALLPVPLFLLLLMPALVQTVPLP